MMDTDSDESEYQTPTERMVESWEELQQHSVNLPERIRANNERLKHMIGEDRAE